MLEYEVVRDQKKCTGNRYFQISRELWRLGVWDGEGSVNAIHFDLKMYMAFKNQLKRL